MRANLMAKIRLPTFIVDPLQTESFFTLGRFFPRTLSCGTTKNQRQTVDLEERFSSTVAQIYANSEPRKIVDVIVVRSGDGMTWSAEKCLATAKEKAPYLRRISMARNPKDKTLAICALIRMGKLIGLAREHGLVTKRKSYTLLILIALLAITVAVNLIAQGASAGPIFETLRKNLVFNAFAILLGLVVAEPISQLLKRLRDRDEIKSLIAETEASKGRESETYERFLRDTSEYLGRTLDKQLLIVDDFDTIDFLSRDILVHYLNSEHFEKSESEYWLVFEKMESQQLFSRSQSVKSAMRRRIEISELYQEPLTQSERTELAAFIGHPERANRLSVKGICWMADETMRDQLVRDLPMIRQDDDKRSCLKLLVFLSAYFVVEPKFLGRAQLAEILRPSNARYAYARDALGDTVYSQHVIRRSMDLIVTIFPTYLYFDRNNSEFFCICAEAAELLMEELPSGPGPFLLEYLPPRQIQGREREGLSHPQNDLPPRQMQPLPDRGRAIPYILRGRDGDMAPSSHVEPRERLVKGPA
jgi:hypothetical protein